MSYKDNIDLSVANAKIVGNRPKTHKWHAQQEGEENVRENMRFLEDCRQAYEALAPFRKRREKMVEYYRGEQWNELIKDPETGDWITEKEYMKNKGKIPFVQNITRQIIKNLIGQYRNNPSKSIVVARSKEDAETSEMMTNALQAVKEVNSAKELDARQYEEQLISGACAGKTTFKYWPSRQIYDVFMENINLNNFFFNTDIQDVRVDHNLYLMGELHELTIDEVVAAFAKDPNDEQRIRDLYRHRDVDYIAQMTGLNPRDLRHNDFYTPSHTHKCRVIEAWRKKGEWRTLVHDYADGSFEATNMSLDEIDEINERRIAEKKQEGFEVDEIPLLDAQPEYHRYWEVYYLTPYGNLLYYKKEPFSHGEHPYSLNLYPLVDGQVWGLIEDIKGQQRYINRLIALLDFIMGAAAKGVLLVPENAIPDDMEIEDFADQWSRHDGVIKFKPNNLNQVPQQVATNATNIGAQEMLQMQMQLLEEISGVSGAMQGQEPSSGTPASLYAQQAQNSSINSLDYLESFNQYQKKRDAKVLKTLQQFYKEKRYLAISGRRYTEEAKLYDPEKARNLYFDLTVTQGTDSPVYRQLIDDTLFKLLESQHIDLEMFLEHTSMPFAQQLLDTVEQRKQEAAQGKAPQGQIPPELMQQMNQQVKQGKQEAQQKSNPQANQMIQDMIQKTKQESQKEPEGQPA